MKIKKNRKCECCKKPIDSWANTKYCRNCSVYISNLRYENYKLKDQVKKLKNKNVGLGRLRK